MNFKDEIIVRLDTQRIESMNAHISSWGEYSFSELKKWNKADKSIYKGLYFIYVKDLTKQVKLTTPATTYSN